MRASLRRWKLPSTMCGSWALASSEPRSPSPFELQGSQSLSAIPIVERRLSLETSWGEKMGMVRQ